MGNQYIMNLNEKDVENIFEKAKKGKITIKEAMGTFKGASKCPIDLSENKDGE